MGHEGVQLVQAIEEEFGICIDDADVASLVTPALLADYVFTRLSSIDGLEAANLSFEGFHRLRSVLVNQFGARRRDVYPDTPIADFLGDKPRQRWAELRQAIDAPHLPALRCRPGVAYPLMAGLPVSGCLIAYAVGLPSWGVVLSLFALWGLGAWIADHLGDQVPEGLSSVGAIVPFVAISTPDDWKREDVLQRVLQITATYLDMPRAAIEADHRFAEDLSLDD